MANEISFSDQDMEIDQGLGYPRAYSRLCRDTSLSPYSNGPPFTFTPYILQPHEALRANELDELFPIIDPNAKPTTKPKIFVSLLWKQLNHLGNAGFDPAILRVDHYGNVLYYHADSASPLSWDIDHWFPCSRGGLTVPSNLRILQKRVCKIKHNKLEFLIPWWDFQLGISINQFLSIFASSSSDFRCRAFSLLFSEGENEELNDLQTVDSHRFPQHFNASKEQVGLAPAAIVLSQRESHDASSALKAIEFSRQLRPNSPITASREPKLGVSKGIEILDMTTNPYQAIVKARDSLRQREGTAKMHLEVQKLDDEVNDLKQKNEEENMAIQDLESVLMKRKRRVEKCRRLAESQSSYRAMLEKMIRDAMHQSVIYKEQVRLNQAASNALTARLEAQKAICDASEKDLHKKFQQRDEIEKQIRPEWEQARKRSKMNDTFVEHNSYNSSRLSVPGSRPRTPKSRTDDAGKNHQTFRPSPETKPRTRRLRMDNSFIEDRYQNAVSSLKEKRPITRMHKELRVFLEEEQKVSEEEWDQEKIKEAVEEKGECSNSFIALDDQNLTGDNIEEDQETRRQRGKGNVEKWLQMLLEKNTPEENLESQNDDIIKKINVIYPQKELNKISNVPNLNGDKNASKTARKSSASEMTCDGEKRGKEREFMRSESARVFRPIPTSPSVILGMRKGVGRILKKPMVTGDDEGDENHPVNFVKSSIKTMKKTLRM